MQFNNIEILLSKIKSPSWRPVSISKRVNGLYNLFLLYLLLKMLNINWFSHVTGLDNHSNIYIICDLWQFCLPLSLCRIMVSQSRHENLATGFLKQSFRFFVGSSKTARNRHHEGTQRGNFTQSISIGPPQWGSFNEAASLRQSKWGSLKPQ